MSDGTIAAPEPDLTPRELIARATALQPMLVERQAEVEERSFYAEDVHRELQTAGIYRTFVPRRYGGYAFDVPTFARIGIELARGCPSTAWCASLASNHALHVGSFFPERAQAEAFGDGDFRAPAVTAPIGVAQRTADGWELTGSVAYCSGAPYSTHYMGQAFMPDEHGGNSGRQLMFLAPRSEWEMVEGSWGDLLGLKGSGSHTLRFDHGHVPSHAVLEDTIMVDVEVEDPANVPGVALHGNPMYGGRTMGLFTITLAAVMVGAVYNALDEYERQLREKSTALPPFVPRREDPDYQRYFGAALAKIGMAEAALLHACEQHMEHCRRAAEEGVPVHVRRRHARRVHRTRGHGRVVGDDAGRPLPHLGVERREARRAHGAHLPRPLDGQQPPQHAAARLRLPRGRQGAARHPAPAPRPAAVAVGPRGESGHHGVKAAWSRSNRCSTAGHISGWVIA